VESRERDPLYSTSEISTAVTLRTMIMSIPHQLALSVNLFHTVADVLKASATPLTHQVTEQLNSVTSASDQEEG